MNSRIPGPCPHTKKKTIGKKKVTFEDVVIFEGDELKTDKTDNSDLQKRVETRIQKLELPKISVESLKAENEALRQRVSVLEARSSELLHELSICEGL